MKAWRLEKIEDIRFCDVEIPKAADGQVIVVVKAAGINDANINAVYEKGTHRMPRTLGHEFSGKVVSVGKYVSADWIGKRVAVFPLIPCRECPACLAKHYELCMQYSYAGKTPDGGFARYVSVPQWNLMALPEKVTYEQAALMKPMADAVHAMRRLVIAKEDTVAVCGLNLTGLFLIMFLLNRGLENIYAIGSQNEEKESVMALGLDESHYCDVQYTDLKKEFSRAVKFRGG